MKQLSVMIIPTLMLAVSCAAQSVVPPPDCLTAASKGNQARRVLNGAVTDCPPDPTTTLGTPGTIPVFNTPATLGDSVIRQNASGGIGVGAANTGSARLSVSGNIGANGNINISGT